MSFRSRQRRARRFVIGRSDGTSLHAEWFEDGMMTGSTQRVPNEMWEENDRERRALWVKLQEELGPRWQVGWSKHFEDGVLNVQWTPDGPLEPMP